VPGRHADRAIDGFMHGDADWNSSCASIARGFMQTVDVAKAIAFLASDDRTIHVRSTVSTTQGCG